MRKILLVFVLLLTAITIISAGCVDDNKPDKIIGTWVSGEHTSSTGTHYTHIVEEFNADYSMEESLYLENGKAINSIALWSKNSDGTYTAIYRSATLEMNKAGDLGLVNSDLLKFENLVFERTDGNTGFTGPWVNSEPYSFSAGFSYIKLIPNADGTGKAVYLDENNEETTPIKFSWIELGKNMFVVSFSEPTQFYFDENGNLWDSFGITYKKSE